MNLLNVLDDALQQATERMNSFVEAEQKSKLNKMLGKQHVEL